MKIESGGKHEWFSLCACREQPETRLTLVIACVENDESSIRRPRLNRFRLMHIQKKLFVASVRSLLIEPFPAGAIRQENNPPAIRGPDGKHVVSFLKCEARNGAAFRFQKPDVAF